MTPHSRGADRVVAVPSLGERNGGIGQVSSSLWNVVRDTWPETSALLPLSRNGHSRPTSLEKVRFGTELAARHLLRQPAWFLFGHLGLTQARRFVPSSGRVPYAVFLHGIEAWKPLDAHRRGALRNARLRIANSEFTARQVTAANPGVGEIAICSLALPKSVTLPDVTPAGARRPIVLMVGRLAAAEGYKGHEQLITAWSSVRARVANAELVIVGEGDDFDRLNRLAATLGVSNSVRFLGFLSRKELEVHYASAALLALPSRGEGFGLVYLEAMAHGLPCLGSVHDAAGEVIGDGGVLVDSQDMDSVTRSIVQLLESPDQRQQLGERGRRRVEERFTYEHFRKKMTSLLRGAFPESEGR